MLSIDVITFQGCPSADKLDDDALAAQNIELVSDVTMAH